MPAARAHAAPQGVPPQVNVLANALLLIVLAFMLFNLWCQTRQTRRARTGERVPETVRAGAEAVPVPV